MVFSNIIKKSKSVKIVIVIISKIPEREKTTKMITSTISRFVDKNCVDSIWYLIKTFKVSGEDTRFLEEIKLLFS